MTSSIDKMQFHRQMIFLVLCLAVVGDIGSFFNSMWTGSELVSHNAGLLIPGADAILPALIGSGVVRLAKKGYRKWKQRRGRSRRSGWAFCGPRRLVHAASKFQWTGHLNFIRQGEFMLTFSVFVYDLFFSFCSINQY